MLVNGAAGIGKTTLVEALSREATAQRGLVLTGRCYDLTETPPYGPWLELLERYRPADADPPSLPSMLVRLDNADARPGEMPLFAAIQDFLIAAAAQQPLMLVLDDLQWADPASLDVFRRLARIVPDLPVLLVATYRTEDVDRQHPLFPLLPLLIREARPVRVTLRALPDDDVRVIIGAQYTLDADALERLVVYLQARAEGNPFYLGELLHTLEDEEVLRRIAPASAEPGSSPRWILGDLTGFGLPPVLRQILDRRLARLTEDECGLLAVAAIIGQEVPLTLWATVVLAEEERLIEVVERGAEAHILGTDADGVRFRFAHALIREALYEGLLPHGGASGTGAWRKP